MKVSEHDDEVRPMAGQDEQPGPGRVTGRQLRELLVDDLWLDELIERAEEGGVRLTGQGGFLPELVKAALEKGLAAELTDQLSAYDLTWRGAYGLTS